MRWLELWVDTYVWLDRLTLSLETINIKVAVLSLTNTKHTSKQENERVRPGWVGCIVVPAEAAAATAAAREALGIECSMQQTVNGKGLQPKKT